MRLAALLFLSLFLFATSTNKVLAQAGGCEQGSCPAGQGWCSCQISCPTGYHSSWAAYCYDPNGNNPCPAYCIKDDPPPAPPQSTPYPEDPPYQTPSISYPTPPSSIIPTPTPASTSTPTPTPAASTPTPTSTSSPGSSTQTSNNSQINVTVIAPTPAPSARTATQTRPTQVLGEKTASSEATPSPQQEVLSDKTKDLSWIETPISKTAAASAFIIIASGISYGSYLLWQKFFKN